MMKNILLLGAGRSSIYLIEYLLQACIDYDWSLTIADLNVQNAQQKLGGHPKGIAEELDISDVDRRRSLIEKANIVVSMLPAFLHIIVAKDCILLNKNLATASYLSPELISLESDILQKGLSFANELGLDPGIDHMTACDIMDDIKSQGGKIIGFKSYTGGLVAPESDNNPWHYKVSWNPLNVVMAGQGTSQYTENNKLLFKSYQRLFREAIEVDIKGYGGYAMYENRDSNKYKELYDLPDVETMVRGTLRHIDYPKAWAVLIDLGLTDNVTKLSLEGGFTMVQFMDCFLPGTDNDWWHRIEMAIGKPISQQQFSMIDWLGLFSDVVIPISNPTPAQIIEHLIIHKWPLNKGDKDLVIMQHEINYQLQGDIHTVYSTLYRTGQDDIHTAMAELVGLPLAIYVKLKMLDQIDKKGIFIPTDKHIYQPILKELDAMGIKFSETII